MTENDIILEVKNLSKVYKEGARALSALKDVSFSARRGQFIVFAGPSGSGKSTLLNLIALLDEASGGSVIFEGRDILKLKEKARARLRLNKIGFVFQFDGLLPEFTVLENVNMPALIRGKNKLARARTLLKNLGIASLEGARPPSLSGGEKQRAAIARALINEPSLLLADEPTGNLDSSRKEQVFKDFAALAKSGLSVLMVTHDMQAASYADVCYRLEGGILIPFDKGEK